MARLIRESADVPIGLRTFVPSRWIKEALDLHDPYLTPLERTLGRAAIHKHWYAITVIAPARYRAGLWLAVGEPDGERVFDEVMNSRRVREVMQRAILLNRVTN